MNIRKLIKLECLSVCLQTVTVPWVERAENNEKKIEHLEDNIQDPVLKAGLVMAYSMFKVTSLRNIHVSPYTCACVWMFHSFLTCTVLQWHIQ